MSITKVTQNTIYHLAGKIIGVLLGVFTIAVMTRYLGQEQFGWYTTAVAFLGIVGIMVDFGLVLVTGQMLGESRPSTSSGTNVVHNLLAFRIITAFIAYIGAGSIIWLFPYTLEIKLAVLLTTVAFFCIALNQIFTGIFQKHLKAQWIGFGEVAQRAVLFVGVLLVARENFGFLPVMGAVVVANIIQTVVLATRAHKIIPLGLAFDRQIWKIIFSKSWPIAISIAFNLIYLRADVFILSLVRSQSEVGLYGAAYRIMDVTTAVPIIFMGLLLPLLASAWSEKNREQFGELIRQGFSMFSIVAIPLLFGGILLATPIMRLVAGSEFTASGPIVQILLIALMGGFLGALFGHAIVAINHQRKTIWIYIVTAVLTLIGYIIFIPKYGIYGAAWMTVFSEALAGMLLWLYVRRATKTRVAWSPLLKALLASLIMTAVLWPIKHLHVLLLIPIGAIVYGVVIIAVRGVRYGMLRELIRP